jgi:hypothetical protein
MGVHTCWIRVVNGVVSTIQVHIRIPACYTDGVSLEPSGGAGVVLACADMVEPCEGNILVPIRAVPQKRLLNPLGGHTEDVVPAIAMLHIRIAFYSKRAARTALASNLFFQSQLS